MRVSCVSVVSVVVLLCVALLPAMTAEAQRGGFGGSRRRAEPVEPNVPYDGRFTFVRLKYSHLPGGDWYGG